MKLLSFCMVMALTLTTLVSEAKTTKTKKATRHVASEEAAGKYGVFCGKMALGESGSGHVTTYTIVDQQASGHGKSFNATIPQDVEISVDFAPAPGDSDPQSDSYRDHNVRIGKEKVWMLYGGWLLEDKDLTQGKCLCISGQVERVDNRNVVRTLQGYAFRNESSCAGISSEAVARYSGHQE